MIGSNRGWIEAPYVPCPAGLDDLAARAGLGRTSETAIVPGVCDPPTAPTSCAARKCSCSARSPAGLIPPDGLVCHPGTHNKWVEVAGGRIATFRTVMTGELFNLLKRAQHPLRPARRAGRARRRVRRRRPPRPRTDDAPGANCSRSARGCCSARRGARMPPSYTSGLLIGGDVRIGLDIGRRARAGLRHGPARAHPPLRRGARRRRPRAASSSTASTAFLAGIRQIAERIA